VRSDHGVDFGSWENVLAYNQDSDLRLAKEFCDEIDIMARKMNVEIEDIIKKQRASHIGLQGQYSNRFRLARHHYKSQRKDIVIIRQQTEKKIVGFRVVLTAIGHSIIASRAAQKNYVPDELLKREIVTQLEMFETQRHHERYKFIEKYKKYWSAKMEQRNKRLHDFFSQKISAFDDYDDEEAQESVSLAPRENSPSSVQTSSAFTDVDVRPMSGLQQQNRKVPQLASASSGQFSSDEDRCRLTDVRTVVIKEEAEDESKEATDVSVQRMKTVMSRESDFLVNLRNQLQSMRSDSTTSSELSDEVSVDEEDRALRSAQWKHLARQSADAFIYNSSSLLKKSTPVERRSKARSKARHVTSGQTHNKLKMRPVDTIVVPKPQRLQNSSVFAGEAREREPT